LGPQETWKKRCSYLSSVSALPLSPLLPARVKGHTDRLARKKTEYQREESRNSRLRGEERKRHQRRRGRTSQERLVLGEKKKAERS